MSSFQNKTGTQSMNGIINITDGIISIENGVITYNDGSTQTTAFSPAILAQVNANTIKLTNVTFNLGTTTITGSLIIPNNSIIQSFVNNGYLDLSTSQSIGGLKTFSSLISANNGLSVLGSLSIPNNSIIQSFVNNGYLDLSSVQSINGSKRFNSLLSAQGITNTAYQSIFGTSTVTCANTDNSKFFYCGSFELIQLIILPLNPIVGATYTFYNAGTFDVQIQANTGNGFEFANQLINIGGTPPSVLLLRGANLILYFRGTWLAIAGGSSLKANISTANTFMETNTFNSPIVLPVASVLDSYLSSNVALKNTLNTFTNLQTFSNGIFPSSINVGTGGTTVFINGNTGAGSFNSITNSTSITTNTLDAISLSIAGVNINTIFVDKANNQVINGVKDFQTNPVFNSGAILDTYLTSNIPTKGNNNTFQATQTFDIIDVTGGILENGVNINQIYQQIMPVTDLTFVNTTQNQVINGVKDFQTNPVFNSGAILDTYLTSNIPTKGNNNTFSATQTFDVIDVSGGILQNGINIDQIYEPFGTFVNFVDLTSTQSIGGAKTFNEMVTSNGLLNTAYQAPFGVSTVNLTQMNSSQFIYCGSFTEIQTLILPTNPIVGTTFTFYNAGNSKVLIEAGSSNGFETANKLIRNGGSPQSVDLLQEAILTLYWRGTWIALSGSSSLIAGLAVANTFVETNTFTQPIILPTESILDSYLTNNIPRLDAENIFVARNSFSNDIYFAGVVRYGTGVTTPSLTIDTAGDLITIGEITCENLNAQTVTIPNNSFPDLFLSVNIPRLDTVNIFSNDIYFNSVVRYATDKLTIDTTGDLITTGGLNAQSLILPQNSIQDSYLSLNIPLLDSANNFNERNTFTLDTVFTGVIRVGSNYENPSITIDPSGNIITTGYIECNNLDATNGIFQNGINIDQIYEPFGTFVNFVDLTSDQSMFGLKSFFSGIDTLFIKSSSLKTYFNTLTSSTAGTNDIMQSLVAYTFIVPDAGNFSQNITVSSPIKVSIFPMGDTLSNFNITLTDIILTVKLNGTVIQTLTQTYGIVKSVSCNSQTLSINQYYVLASFTFSATLPGTYTVFFNPIISSSPYPNIAGINSTLSGGNITGFGASGSLNSPNGFPYASPSLSLSNAVEPLINTVGVNDLNASGNITVDGNTLCSNFEYVNPRVEYPSLHQIGFQTVEASFSTNIFIGSNQYTGAVSLLKGVYMFQVNQIFTNANSVATTITKTSVGITLSNPSSGVIPFIARAKNISFAYSIPATETYETSCVFMLQTTATDYYAGAITTGSNGVSTTRNTILRITRIA